MRRANTDCINYAVWCQKQCTENCEQNVYQQLDLVSFILSLFHLCGICKVGEVKIIVQNFMNCSNKIEFKHLIE